MNQLSSDILALTKEAGVLIEKNRIAYANSAAMGILGAECIGKNVAAVFGADLAENQASNFVGEVPINGKHYIVRVAKSENTRVIFFSSPEKIPNLLSEPFLVSLRGGLSTIGLGLDRSRAYAEELQDGALLSNFSAMTRGYYGMLRLLDNAAIIKGLFDKNLSYQFVSLNLSQVYGDLMQIVTGIFKNINWNIDLGENIMINADFGLVQRLLMNLVSNVLNHAKDCDKMSVSLSESGNSVLLSVSDNGKGIPQDALHTVFERYRYNYRIGELGNGAGIGMSVCAGIAEIHGGTVLIESREGHGTTVRVSLSKRSGRSISLGSGKDQSVEIKTVLIALADCIPIEYYSEKYMD